MAPDALGMVSSFPSTVSRIVETVDGKLLTVYNFRAGAAMKKGVVLMEQVDVVRELDVALGQHEEAQYVVAPYLVQMVGCQELSYDRFRVVNHCQPSSYSLSNRGILR